MTDRMTNLGQVRSVRLWKTRLPIDGALGVFDDPVDWGELCEPSARWSQLTKCFEGCPVVTRVQLALQRLHYAIEHIEAVKID